jgi:hypothetical protein
VLFQIVFLDFASAGFANIEICFKGGKFGEMNEGVNNDRMSE